MATSTSGMHVVQQSMHLRRGQGHHCDVEVVYETCNCHLEVAAKNFDKLFDIEANVAVSQVQQCSSPSLTWVVCSHLMFKVTNHCNQSWSGIPVKHLKNPGHIPVYFQLVLCHHCNDLVRCELARFRLKVLLPGFPSAWRVWRSQMDLNIPDRTLWMGCGPLLVW